jgi:hypothetical protein
MMVKYQASSHPLSLTLQHSSSTPINHTHKKKEEKEEHFKVFMHGDTALNVKRNCGENGLIAGKGENRLIIQSTFDCPIWAIIT